MEIIRNEQQKEICEIHKCVEFKNPVLNKQSQRKNHMRNEKIHEKNENKNVTYQNLWDTDKLIQYLKGNL